MVICSLVVSTLLGVVSLQPQAPGELQGKWQLVSYNAHPNPKLGAVSELAFDGKRFERTFSNGRSTGVVVLENSKEPKEIDFRIEEGPGKGSVQRGLYKLSDDELTLCVAPPGADRPAGFDPEEGKRIHTEVWRRQPK